MLRLEQVKTLINGLNYRIKAATSQATEAFNIAHDISSAVAKVKYTVTEMQKNVTTTSQMANEALYTSQTAVTTADEALSASSQASGDADSALSLANTVQSTKLDKENPVGSGSLTMNGLADAQAGDCAVTLGTDCAATGRFSFASGAECVASGLISHAEGYSTTASGDYSHAEGCATTTSGLVSHAEGYGAKASGDFSHAEGCQTHASGLHSHVQGKYNIEDTTSTYAHIVGNGTSGTKRSNAHTLDWVGNAWFAGDVYVGSTSGTNKDEGSERLAKISEISTLEAIVEQVLEALPTWKGGNF